ncbi:MAG: hypothetical protein R2878_04480 [Thermoleophilia bacterium]
MSLLDQLNQHANRLVDEVQGSLRKARAEGERRLILRQHRAALEELGERAYSLIRSGELQTDLLDPEVRVVESKLAELEAKSRELDAASTPPEAPGPPGGAHAAPAAEPAIPPADEAAEPVTNGPGPGWDAANRFFPPSGRV